MKMKMKMKNIKFCEKVIESSNFETRKVFFFLIQTEADEIVKNCVLAT